MRHMYKVVGYLVEKHVLVGRAYSILNDALIG